MGPFPMRNWAQWGYGRHGLPGYNLMMERSLLFAFLAALLAVPSPAEAESPLALAYASASSKVQQLKEQAKLDERLLDAGENNDEAAIAHLLSHGAQAVAKDAEIDNNTPLHFAAAAGNAAIVKALFQVKLEIDARNAEGNTPLMFAAVEGSTEIVWILLNNKADVNAVNNSGAAPLCLAKNAEIARMLIERGANVRAVAKNGSTMLHCAALTGDPEVVKLFLKMKLDPDAKDSDGLTPFDLANSFPGRGGDHTDYPRVMRMLKRAMSGSRR